MMMGIALKSKEAKEVLRNAMELGLIILTAKDKVRLLPPLSITYDEIQEGLDIFRMALK